MKNKIIQEAREWIGTKFQHQGRIKGVGVDCIGLVIGALLHNNIDITNYDETGYSRIPDGYSFQNKLSQAFTEVDNIEVGDVVLFRFKGQPQHVGIASDIGIIHAYAPAKKVVEHRLDNNWLKRIVAIYRVKN